MAGPTIAGRPRVAVIHAVTGSVQPSADAFAESFPEAEVWQLVDDRLLTDANRDGGVTPELATRMRDLIGYATGHGADGLLLACSQYGQVAESVRGQYDLPILTADQMLFDEVLARRPARAVLVAAQAPAARDSADRLVAHLAASGVSAEVVPVVVEPTPGQTLTDAAQALVAPLAASADLVVLANFSLAGARADLEAGLGVAVLAPPQLAASALRRLLLPTS